jgi:DNA-binding response OmpR family regulator
MTNTRKILIVDDDSELREALVEQLALLEEFESIAVDNGTKGVQTAKAGQIDLVIMDVGLPDARTGPAIPAAACRRGRRGAPSSWGRREPHCSPC